MKTVDGIDFFSLLKYCFVRVVCTRDKIEWY